MSAQESSVSSDHLLRLNARDLLIGMFISEIDCAWSDTPFPMGGFHLKTAGDIQILQKYCKTVEIDTNRGLSPPRNRAADLTILSSARKAAPSATALKVDRDTYPVIKTIKQQIDKANQDYETLVESFQHVADGVRTGKKLELEEIEKSSASIVSLILANPQTLIWILNTESNPRTPTAYCVRAAIWATILARQFGMSEKEIKVLFLGTLLCDIGLHLLPERLVNKRGPFRKKEFLAYRKHVEFGLELLTQHPELDDKIMRIVRCHHERHDGLGFPKCIKGEQLPSLARFANMAYCFERLLYTNCVEKSVSPANGITRLYKQRMLKFPEQLIVEFIHVMGMYPIGSVVEISTGELAIILEQNESERLFPKIAVITDDKQKLLQNPAIVDLGAKSKDGISRTINNSANLNNAQIDLEEYRFQFFGKKLGLGSLAVRF
jgi:HD-GYP domain-containing protein (c-di-GMP phosphodiesterase class II)